MHILENLSLRRKIISSTMLVASVVLVSSFAFLVIYQTLEYRETLIHNTDVIATLNSYHGKSALEFQDRVTAEKSLQSLKAKPSVLAAFIFDAEGRIFAEYRQGKSNEPLSFDDFKASEFFFTNTSFFYSKKIMDEEELLGVIALQMDLKPFYNSLKFTILAAAVFLVCSLLVSYLLAAKLETVITRPILGLVNTSRVISSTNDYSVRAPKGSSDEAGLLVDTFNEMLTQIEERDGELSEQRAQLAFALQEAEAANEAKSLFLATVSHEIRTPLNGIQASLHILKNSDLTEKDKEFVEVALKSCLGLGSIINDVLDLSKIEAEKMTIELQDVILEDVVSRAIETQRPRAMDKNLDLKATIEEGFPKIIRTDPTRLLQILLNLISNAIKFTSQGGVEVKVSKGENNKGPAIKFEIIDTGIGIPLHTQHLLFQAFQQADTSTTRKYGGTGLGLAICKELVMLMGGDIDVISEFGSGSTFVFNLPLFEVQTQDSHEEVRESSSHANAEIKQYPESKVLVADDNEVNRIVIKELLSFHGISPVVVNNGKEAVEEYKNNPFDIVFLDLHMPEMDGFEAAVVIRAYEEEKTRNDKVPIITPIIALTADVTVETQKTCKSIGMNAFLTKPLDPKKLATSLQNHIK